MVEREIPRTRFVPDRSLLKFASDYLAGEGLARRTQQQLPRRRRSIAAGRVASDLPDADEESRVHRIGGADEAAIVPQNEFAYAASMPTVMFKFAEDRKA